MPSIFSKIIAGEIPSYKVYEDERVFAFLDINPEVRGHVLVVPKVEVEKVYELPEADYVALWAAVRKVAQRIEEVYGVRAIMKVFGVDVAHAHVHVMPFDESLLEREKYESLGLAEADFLAIRDELKF